MKTKAPIPVILLLAAALIIVSCSKNPPRRRNVILISIDSLRADHLGAYGYDKPTSPAIDAFAQSGSLFRHAYATSPWTLPSHATMFTGLYIDTHGVYSERTALKEDAVTLPKLLSRHHYRTGAVVCAPLLKKRYGLHHGFDTYDEDLVEKSYTRARRVKVGPKVTEKGLDWIDKQGDKPFFLFLHYWDVHYDYNPPKEYVDLFNPGYQGIFDGLGIRKRKDIVPGMPQADFEHFVALYDGEIRYTDDAIKTLLDGLEKRGLDQNTAIIITSDHGEELLDHGGTGHTRTVYEELVRIPFIMRVPWHKNPEKVIDAPVSLVDIFPTITDFLGVPRTGLTLQGLSLDKAASHGMTLAERKVMTETRRGRLDNNKKAPGFRWAAMVGGDRHKLHRLKVRENNDPWRFYDLAADPTESVNLMDEKTELAGEYKDELVERQKLHQKMKKVLATGEEKELDPELAETLKGLGYLQ